MTSTSPELWVKSDFLDFGSHTIQLGSLFPGGVLSIRAYVPGKSHLFPNQPVDIKTGLRFKYPTGYGLSVYSEQALIKSTVYIDGGPFILTGVYGEYCDPITIRLINGSSVPYQVHHGDIIAKAILISTPIPTLRSE